MAMYLSKEWMDAARQMAHDLPEVKGASLKIGYQINGGPNGDVRFHVVFEDGVLVEQALGDRPDLAVVLVIAYADAVLMQTGELDQNVAFMQGKIKVGPGADMTALMALLPLTNSAAFRAMQKMIHEMTEF